MNDLDLERLLRLTEVGARPSELGSRRARQAAHAAWSRLLIRRRWRRRAALVAAALVAAFLGLTLVSRGGHEVDAPVVATVERWVGGPVQSGGRRLASGDAIRLGESLATTTGRASLRLPDGHSVRLDAQTSLRFAAETRIDLGAGAVYLDSGSSSGPATVRVTTAFGAFVERGTQFEVRVDGERARVRVREGTVVLLRDETAVAQAPAGEELTIDHRGEISSRVVPRFGEPWAWVLEVSPTLQVDGRTLGVLLDGVAREMGWIVRYDGDQEWREIVVHGLLGEVTPAEAPAAILPTCGLEARLERGELVVTRPGAAVEGAGERLGTRGE